MSDRISYKVTNLEELEKEYPEIVTEERITRKVIDRKKLYQIVKLNHALERKIPGVEIDAPAPEQIDIESASLSSESQETVERVA